MHRTRKEHRDTRQHRQDDVGIPSTVRVAALQQRSLAPVADARHVHEASEERDEPQQRPASGELVAKDPLCKGAVHVDGHAWHGLGSDRRAEQHQEQRQQPREEGARPKDGLLRHGIKLCDYAVVSWRGFEVARRRVTRSFEAPSKSSAPSDNLAPSLPRPCAIPT